MSSPKLQLAIAGVGRMGMRHAKHFAFNTPQAELIAVASPVQAELDAAKREFGGELRTYLDYGEMLKHESTLQAVVIATPTSLHAEQTLQAIEKGLHVLCEKPISLSPEISQSVADAYRESLKTYPNQKVICGFSRRFDPSYRDAYRRVANGEIGRPSVLRSQTCDKLDPSGAFVAYAQHSGGIFVDCCIHDIDAVLWFFGDDPVLKSVSAIGVTAVQPELRKYNDRDNALGIIEFEVSPLSPARNIQVH
jgi:myo-inositol 2-dehydrogenase / D-chiro-inositol 1-dehydrogenase